MHEGRFLLVAISASWLSCADSAAVDHVHDADEITAGTLDNARLHMGPGSGLDSDRLDGREASDFAPAHQTPVLWVGADTAPGSLIGGYTYYPDQVNVDTTEGHLTYDDDGTLTIGTAGYYRIHAYASAGCRSVAATSCTLSLSVKKNGVEADRDIESGGMVGAFSAKLESTYLDELAAGDTLAMEYACDLTGAMLESCSISTNSVQIEFLGPR